ncbi:hypothetical protein JKP88DRAFT_255467 [Tribonema minus]|uniref:Uncharacterized protein n=1 Tax=Tribonema minus TaxID=303371 RepID=A0A835Z3P9_9STRA|nr:hypothetical protein JKP88DRAFT_255467 [Tribonema minus]
MQRKIRKQDRVRRVLEAVYAVDNECHIRYADGCVPDPDKFFARLDMHVIGIVRAVVVVECDEFGHADYMVSCEQTRMEQVHEAVLKAQFADAVADLGETAALAAPLRPVVFVRYNPDAREVDGVKERVRRMDKEAQLMKALRDIDDGSLQLSHSLNIIYIGYDMLEGEPAVCRDTDYSPQMRGSIVLVV